MSYEAFEKAIVLGHKVELEDGKIISSVEATVGEDIIKENIFKMFLRNIKELLSGNLKF